MTVTQTTLKEPLCKIAKQMRHARMQSASQKNVADKSLTAAQKLYTAIELCGAPRAAVRNNASPRLQLEQAPRRFLSRGE